MIGEFPRRTSVYLMIEGKDVWNDIREYVRGITFEEVSSGETDSFDVTMHDINEHYMNDWLINKGTKIEGKIKLIDWDKPGDERMIDCGEFLCDSLQIKGYPLEVKIKSLALPAYGSENTRKWENIKLSAVAQDICKQLGCELNYYGDDILLDSKQQTRQTDVDFLFSLCNEYGFGMKVYRHKIAIFDKEKQDAAEIISAFNLRNICESFTIDDNEEGTYTGVQATYTPEGSDRTYDFSLGSPERTFTLDSTATSLQEVEIKSKAALYKANSEAVQLKFSCLGGYAIYPGNNHYLYNLGKYSGKYAIDRVTHTLSETGIYKIAVEAHAVNLEKDGYSLEAAMAAAEDAEMISAEYPNKGKKLELNNCPLYNSSTDKYPRRYVTGTYYLFDGKDFSGRYRATSDPSVIERRPIGEFVTGYIDGKYIY